MLSVESAEYTQQNRMFFSADSIIGRMIDVALLIHDRSPMQQSKTILITYMKSISSVF